MAQKTFLLPTGRKNQMLIQAINGVHQARQKEDAAYRRFSGKDLTSSSLVTTRPFTTYTHLQNARN